MKKLTAKHIIPIIVAAVVLIATLTIALSLSMCHYEEPDDLPQQSEVKSPYGNYDYSKKPYFSLEQEYGVLIYKGNGYFMNSGGEFQSFSLLDLSKNMKEYVRGNKQEPIQQQAIYVCPVSEHNHGLGGGSLFAGCPAFANLARWFVLDAYESNGSFPIFYYADITDQKAGSGLNDNDAWDLASTYSIYRYDSGSNTRESLAETGNYPIQMMIYGDSVYIITQGSKKEYQLNLLDKKSKKWTELAIGEDKLELLSANDEFVYVSDLDGHVYQVKSDLQSYDLIYTVEDAYVLSSGEITLGIFMDGDYIYFRSDYDTEPMPINDTQFIEPTHYNIRRISVNDPNGESELVAEDVFQKCELGVSDGKFYYSPKEYGENAVGYYYNFTSGKIKCVDL